MTPEQNLWVNVIAQQFHDATRKILPPKRKKNGKTQDRPNNNSIYLARTWLSDNTEDFQIVCSLAGLEPEWVMKEYKKVKAGGSDKIWSKRVNYV
jgi:hypothetical protein